jgi:hypothetical protein
MPVRVFECDFRACGDQGGNEMTTKAHLQALAEHYPSLLVSGVAHGALKEIERLDRDLTIERNLNDARQLLTAKLEARLAIAVDALEGLAAENGWGWHRQATHDSLEWDELTADRDQWKVRAEAAEAGREEARKQRDDASALVEALQAEVTRVNGMCDRPASDCRFDRISSAALRAEVEMMRPVVDRCGGLGDCVEN